MLREGQKYLPVLSLSSAVLRSLDWIHSNCSFNPKNINFGIFHKEENTRENWNSFQPWFLLNLWNSVHLRSFHTCACQFGNDVIQGSFTDISLFFIIIIRCWLFFLRKRMIKAFLDGIATWTTKKETSFMVNNANRHITFTLTSTEPY